MDVVFPLYEDLGLLLIEKKKFQDILKRLIKSHLRSNKENPYPWVEPQILSDLEMTLKKELSSKDYLNFICFATTIYDNRNSLWLEWRDWEDAFSKMLFPIKYYTQQFVDSSSEELRFKLIAAYNSVPSKKYKIDSIDAFDLYLSDWDQMIFKTASFDILSDYDNPYVELRYTEYINRFQIFWEEYVLKLTEVELNQIYSICNTINLSKNTLDRMEDFPQEDGTVNKILLPGLKFDNLKSPNSMRRCLTA